MPRGVRVLAKATRRRPRAAIARRRKPRASINLSSIGRVAASIVGNRVLSLYPRSTTDKNVPSSSWLDALRFVGTCAMKLVATVLFGSSLEATPAPVLGAVQCVLLGVDEFLINHPLCEILSTVVQPPTGPTVTLKTPFVDYKQAGVSVVQIKITPSAVIAQRGGQICAALVALTREESDAYVMGSEYQRADLVSEYTATPLESPSFVDIQQYPGSITKPASSSISITRRTKGFQAMKHRIGADNYINGVLGGTKGGPFLYKLYYGYSDMAASSGDAKQLYRAEEGMFNVSCSARVTLFECGRTFLRAFPVVTCLTNSVAICDGQGLGRVEHELPLSFFSGVGQNMVLRKTRSEVESYLRGDPIVEEIEDG